MHCRWQSGNDARWNCVMCAAGRIRVAIKLKRLICPRLFEDSGEIGHAVERG
jgi:hypothetical protein